ncbi:MAG: 50S ribosomal protein L13 [Anaerolineaceae bacterium]|nr:50S ribosomal protein L13 [Anaerolineaceae bacterium]
MNVEKTYVIKGKPESKWVLFDASRQSLGRLATQIAFYLLGKHKPDFTPGVEMGDYVVVINASQLGLTQRLLNDKNYYRHSGYPGGIKKTSLPEMMNNHPDRVVRAAVWGMLPHNKIGRKLIKRLKIYPGSEHPHAAQNPNPVA